MALIHRESDESLSNKEIMHADFLLNDSNLIIRYSRFSLESRATKAGKRLQGTQHVPAWDTDPMAPDGLELGSSHLESAVLTARTRSR
jgi:hypothetical protein